MYSNIMISFDFVCALVKATGKWVISKIELDISLEDITVESPVCEPKMYVPEEGEKCAICRDEMNIGSDKRLECGHLFHEECIVGWLERCAQCPLCRKEVKLTFDMMSSFLKASELLSLLEEIMKTYPRNIQKLYDEYEKCAEDGADELVLRKMELKIIETVLKNRKFQEHYIAHPFLALYYKDHPEFVLAPPKPRKVRRTREQMLAAQDPDYIPSSQAEQEVSVVSRPRRSVPVVNYQEV